jgi:hypothetical protein
MSGEYVASAKTADIIIAGVNQGNLFFLRLLKMLD